MKALHWTSIGSFVLLMIVAFFADFLFVYENDFDFQTLVDAMYWSWKPFVIYPVIIVSVASLISAVLRKRVPFLKTFAIATLLLNLAALLLSIGHGTEIYVRTKKEYQQILSKRLKTAEFDVNNDLIVFNSYGFPMLLSGEMAKGEKKIDSLRRSYGISYVNNGCMITQALLKADDEYENFVTPHLDKRNGKGWEHRLQGQIEDIRKKYR